MMRVANYRHAVKNCYIGRVETCCVCRSVLRTHLLVPLLLPANLLHSRFVSKRLKRTRGNQEIQVEMCCVPLQRLGARCAAPSPRRRHHRRHRLHPRVRGMGKGG